jgi:hypothetical protein
MATVFEPIRPVPPMTTIFMVHPLFPTTEDPQMGRIQVKKILWASARVHNATPWGDKL